MRTSWTIVGTSLLILLAAGAASADETSAATTTSQTIEKELGVFVYPKKSQDAATQAKDTAECY